MGSVPKQSLWGKDSAKPIDPRDLPESEQRAWTLAERFARAIEFADYLATLPYAEAHQIVNALGRHDAVTRAIEHSYTETLRSDLSPGDSELLLAARRAAVFLGGLASRIAAGGVMNSDEIDAIKRMSAAMYGQRADVRFRLTLLGLFHGGLADIRRGAENKMRVPAEHIVARTRERVWARLCDEFPVLMERTSRDRFDEVFDSWCAIVDGRHQPGLLGDRKNDKSISGRIRIVADLLRAIGAMDPEAKDASLRNEYHAMLKELASAK